MGGEGTGRKAVEIGVCRWEDLAEIKRILEEAPEAAGWSGEALEEELAKGEFLVARSGGEAVGFIVGRPLAEEAEILNLAVRRDRRRFGVGKALVEDLLERYVGRGIGRVFLEVRESNRAAVELYRGLGFKEVGRRAGYYREPVEAALVLMRGG